MLTLIRTDSTNTDFQKLVALLDADLKIRDGDDHSFYSQFNTITDLKQVVLIYENKIAIACGSFKKFSEKTVEIKRMFVVEDRRGRGIAQQILNELEKWAAELNYDSSILETGKNQPEAIRLYEKSGFIRIPNYGQYEHIENSVCMKKNIK